MMKKINQAITTTVMLFFLLTLSCAHSNQGDEKYFISDGVKIFFRDVGVGPQTVVLLHGYAMEHSMWLESGIHDSLSKNNRVIAVDMRGHGKSDKPPLPTDYGPKLGSDVINLLDHLKIEKAHVVGFSMGAFVTGRLLISHPDRLASATLCSGGFPLQNEAEKEFQVSTAEHMAEQGDTALANVALGWSLDGVSKEQIKNIKVPILSVFGSEEMDQNTRHQIELLKLPQSSRTTIVIEGADHDSHQAAVLHPKFLSALKEFISSN